MSFTDPRAAYARFGSRWANEVVEIADGVACLQGGGFWAVVVTFEGEVRCVRFAEVDEAPAGYEQPRQAADWMPLTGDWSSSLDEPTYLGGVRQIRQRIAAGDVYQVSLCRVVSHPLAEDADLASLEPLVLLGNPAPFACRIHVPTAGLDVLSASPEAS